MITTSSVVLALAVLLAYAHAVGAPITIAMLGTIVAMQCGAIVRDRTQHARVVTTVLMVFPAAASVVLAASLSEFGWVADAGFIAVLFVAVWIRRYGARGLALGMVAFISYFFALFLRAKPDQIPEMLGAVAIGVAMALVVRRMLLPDRPKVEVRRLTRALRASSSAVLEIAAASGDRRPDIEVLRRGLERLGATALMIEDWLDRNNAARHLSVTSEDLSMRVFDAQIATEQLVSALWALDPSTRWPRPLGQATTALSSCLRDNPTERQLRAARRIAGDAAAKADQATQAGVATLLAQRAAQAHIAIHHITTNAMREPGRGAQRSPSPTHGTAPGSGDASDSGGRSGLDPSTKAAIQVAVATTAATVLGELISPNRWYWAVLTAFLVFTGASTRGEILTRAGHRVVGTILGVFAGIILAALIGHNPPVQLALIVVCVFFAFYLVRVAYAWLTFFVTVLLAMLYGLLGTFTIELLALRVEETAVGAAVGIAAAYAVVSTRTRSTALAQAQGFLDRLSEVVDESVESIIAPGGEVSLVAATRELDSALQDAVAAAKPMESRTTRTWRSTRRMTRVLQVSGRAARGLARAGVLASRADRADAPSPETAAALRDAAAHVRGNIDAVGRRLAGEPVPRPDKATETKVIDVLLTTTNTPGPLRGGLRALSKLNRTVLELL